jgi:acyl CoA:acetate/3-ketoacid CoA transferase alpha subunit
MGESRVGKPLGNKVMTAKEAVATHVFDGATIGMGGQSIGRNSMALAHEIVRQGKRDLTLVGCNLALSMDIMVGAGLVRRTESGTGNLERYGAAMRWRRAVEEGSVEVEDYSHLAMASRFLAGALGLPFMPSKSLLGTDILNKRRHSDRKAFELVDNPWNPGEPVVLLPACQPDVSIIHVQKADEMGNVIIEGFTTQEPEMVRASKAVIVSCEELISSDEVRKDPDRTTIPYIFVDAVVEQRWGAYPTSTYRYYEHDDEHLLDYQGRARAGGDEYQDYLQRSIYDCNDFDEYLEKAAGSERLDRLRSSMQEVL